MGRKLEKNIDQLRQNIRKQIPAIQDLIETNKKILKVHGETGNEELLKIVQEIGKITNALLFNNNELFHCYEKFCLIAY